MKINKVMEEKLMRKALVVVDMQNDFIDGALGTTEAQEMLPRLVEKSHGGAGGGHGARLYHGHPRCGLSPDAGGAETTR